MSAAHKQVRARAVRLLRDAATTSSSSSSSPPSGPSLSLGGDTDTLSGHLAFAVEQAAGEVFGTATTRYFQFVSRAAVQIKVSLHLSECLIVW